MNNRLYTMIIILIICSNLNAGWKDLLLNKFHINEARERDIKNFAHGMGGGVFYTALMFSTKDLMLRLGKRMGYNTQPEVHGLIITTTFVGLVGSWWFKKNIIPVETVIPKIYGESAAACNGLSDKSMKGFLTGIGASLLLGHTANEALSKFPYRLDIALKKVCNVSGC